MNIQTLPLPPIDESIIAANQPAFYVTVACRRNSAIHSWPQRQHVRMGVIASIEINPYGDGSSYAYFVHFDNGESADYIPLEDSPRIVELVEVG